MKYPVEAGDAIMSSLQLRNSDGNRGWDETISPWENFWVITYQSDFDMEGDVASNKELASVS